MKRSLERLALLGKVLRDLRNRRQTGFCGSLLLLTEQVALLDTIPAFRGVKPEVETRPSLCG